MAKMRQRERVFAAYKYLVQPIAAAVKRTLPASIELDDLVQEGLKGLWTAAGKFRRKQAATFEFYVRTKIRGAMLDSVKGRQWREATHRELPPALQICDRRPSVEQQMIAREEADANAATRRDRLSLVARAVADPDPKFQPISGKQKRALYLRYGRGMTQPAAGTAMGITQQSLQQLEDRALRSLRRKVAA
jgi:RNA polymerase sigma factor (sigma-70 family)